MPAIEKNIPMPVKYPFADMEVGDSFFVRATPDKAKAIANRLRASAYVFRLKTGQNEKFSVRIISDGCRCWRTA